MNQKELKYPFWRRFLIYQKERFPFLAHGPLIAMFTFSAISYSRICRNETGFINWQDFLIGIITILSLFFLVRILDEFKDKEEDAMYRKELPVPRGLISFKELRYMGFAALIIQVLCILFFQLPMIWIYAIVLIYLALMTVEFFIPEWLKENPIAYLTSHMFIIPIIDLYSSGLDWLLEGHKPHLGLLIFFIVSYLNGLVLEFGRKIKSPNDEKEGVKTYSFLYGPNKATYIWLGILLATFLFCSYAIYYASIAYISIIILSAFFIITAFCGISFLLNMNSKSAKRIEIFSAVWTLVMYACIGGLPGFIKLI